VVVGTHALIQDEVSFARLGLAVVDEQHRFGVLQRKALSQKGYRPHLLVMTATPIPRSLALTIYGDLDLSVIDELPPGRQEIRTRCFGPEERRAVYAGIRVEIEEGRQAFVICPLVEESDRLEAKAATAEYERLRREVYPDLRLGLLHGRMKPGEKDGVMRSFQRGEIDLLVSTAVVEVGIDVPNATCMIIEGAERFGLAQLHQFRGRIGRGSERSYCALVSESDSEVARKRLEVVAATRDGFKLAEEDLRLRGPGEFFGTRQSGLPDGLLARAGDVETLERARECARTLAARDPGLERPEHQLLAERVRELRQAGDAS
jgi:ATP-dependent DNA helicase RecG